MICIIFLQKYYCAKFLKLITSLSTDCWVNRTTQTNRGNDSVTIHTVTIFIYYILFNNAYFKYYFICYITFKVALPVSGLGIIRIFNLIYIIIVFYACTF